MIGTKSTPPPTPPRTAAIPRKKVTTKRIKGHAHQGIEDSPTAFSTKGSAPKATGKLMEIIAMARIHTTHKKNLRDIFRASLGYL
jgi:hypothetical protein